jgi:hypothetical protein
VIATYEDFDGVLERNVICLFLLVKKICEVKRANKKITW